ncbi:glutaminyl-peptide cyclotransferase [Marinifilum caeruleilacunae]|uniref:Glutaminyl-peptide cyclotransferase n=1 Tax=Marinifilum caeruleilacunae TaxID=2499076 RepID=A0ABX1WZ61_9BACT|nr:glutaminyl-peptide cyclotransferase [Marinifilum caeruleilacunae]NOU61251.1 glutaminyl-peptide cyclotransferase [Marinifilum caeruleilacunae]
MKFQILLSSLFFILSGCGNNDVKKTETDKKEVVPTVTTIEFVNSMRLKAPKRGDVFAYGEEIELLVHPKKKSGDIDSLQLWGDGKLVQTITEKPWNLKWIPTKDKMGKHNIKLLAYHENGTVGLLTTYINIKSDKLPDQYSYEIINSFPHDRRAYTQGLFFHEGFLYEGTGQHGESSLRKVRLENGEAISIKNLEQEYFGEGITYSKNRIIQLTWNSRKVFVVDPETFEQIDFFEPQTTNNEGWGITTMNNELVISDGSNILTILDDTNYGKKRSIEVYDNNGAVTNLNELEYINGKIYANVWLTERIVIINPETGRVEGSINLGKILKQSDRIKLDKNDDVLNGIAWDEASQRMFVTGKRWPKLFEIKIEKK